MLITNAKLLRYNNMTIHEIVIRKEDQTFDCKSIQINPKGLAIPIVAFANAICPPPSSSCYLF